MADTASDYSVKRLHDRGIRRVYGFPGAGINRVFGALDRRGDKVEFIQARHEEEAAFMRRPMRNLPARSVFASLPPARVPSIP
jgi:glyoxylate carboligase